MSHDHALVITYPGRDTDPEAPTDLPRERRFGPFGSADAARQHGVRLQETIGRARPLGYRIAVEDYDPAVPHEAWDVPRHEYGIAELLRAEGNDGPHGGHSWPDVYDLLVARNGYSVSGAYSRALAMLSAEEEIAEEQRAEEEAAAERLAPSLAEIADAIATKRGALYTKVIAHAAAAMLADVLDVGEQHRVPRTDWGYVAQIPGVCLDAITTSVRTRRTAGGCPPAELIARVAKTLDVLHPAAAPGGMVGGEVPFMTFSAVGWRDRLVIGVDEDGWAMRVDKPTSVRPLTIHAPFTLAGADSVAELCASIARDEGPRVDIPIDRPTPQG